MAEDEMLRVSLPTEHMQYYTLEVDFANKRWKEVAAAAFTHLLSPIIIPAMILLSKIRGKKVGLFRFNP